MVAPPRRHRNVAPCARSLARRLLLLPAVVLALTLTTTATAGAAPGPASASRTAASDPVEKLVLDPPPGSALARILDRGYIRVGVKYDLPTFGLRNLETGQPEGFEPDLARYIAAKLFGDSNRLQLNEAVNANRVPFLEADKLDIVVSQLTITASRAKQVSFSDVYYASALRLAANRDSGITDLASLAGKAVCVTPGSTAITELQKTSPDARIVTMAANSQCFDAIRDRRVDAMSSDDSTLAGFIARDPQLALVGPPLAAAPYGIGAKKGNDDLVAALNQIIADFKADGTWQRTYDTWVRPVTQVDMGPPPAESGVDLSGRAASASSTPSLWSQLIAGLWVTVRLVAGAFAAALVLGIVLAVSRRSRSRSLRGIGLAASECFRNTPLLVLMYIFTSGLAKTGAILTPFTAALIALGLYTSGYVAEIVRAGFDTIHAGQREAAEALGLSSRSTLRLIVLPQALRAVAGPLGTQLVLTIKNSSVAAAIAVADLMAQAQNHNALTFQTVQAFVGVALAYLMLTVPVSLLSQWGARRVRITT